MAATTSLTVNFSVPDGPDIVFVERIENPDGVRFLGHFGRRLLSHTTSSDKAVAAWNPEAEQAGRLAGFPPRVSKTVRTEADWLRCLDQLRKLGYAVSHSEFLDGASSVALPVIHRRVAIASVSVFGPTEVLEPEVDSLVPVFVAASRPVSRAYTG